MGNFNACPGPLQLHRLDAGGAHIQTYNRFRSESKHVPAFYVARALWPAACLFYCELAARAAFGFFRARVSTSLLCSSIHWSSFDFLNRQRFPSLKAGIFCSFTYLYSVSGLTPRYCDAWRMFITSRASTIVSAPSTEKPRRAPCFDRLPCRGLENSSLKLRPYNSVGEFFVCRAYLNPER